MNRTQKKCFFAATGTHLLLLVILFVGPAFLSSRNKTDDLPVIEFVPMLTTDKLVSGGGSPTANPPPAPPPQSQQQIAPPVPKPPPQVERVEKQEPAKVVKTDKTDPNAVDKPHKPKVSTTLVKRSQTTPTKPKTTVSKSDAQATKSAGKEFTAAARRIREGASSSTDIEMPGLGGGGPSYANYAQVVKSIYMHAWIEPTGVEDNEATATVSVTIARDGTVISARIIQSSGNTAVDRAVQATLDRVPFIAPFPDGVKESERTYKLNFNLKINQLLG